MRFIWRFLPFLDWRKSYWKALENIIFGKTKLKDIFSEYVMPSRYNLEKGDKNRLFDSLPKEKRQRKQLKIKDLFSLFLEGFLDIHKPYILLLANSGMGKTTFLQKLFTEYAQTYPDFDLAFVYCGQDTDEQLAQIPNPEKTVLFLDALDEDTQARHNLDARLKNLQNPLVRFAKVIVSCRVQFFTNRQEEWRYLLGSIRIFILRLDQFTPDEAKTYLQKKYKKTKEQNQALAVFGQNQDFFCCPLLLSYFDDLLDSEQPFNFLYQIFEHIVKKWAVREGNIVEANKPNKREYDKFLPLFCKELAHQFYSMEKTEVLYEEIKPLLSQWQFKPIDAQSRTLLSRKKDTFAFTHHSFYSYFLAILLFEQRIKEENAKNGKRKPLFEQMPEVTTFYKEMLCHKIVKKTTFIELDTEYVVQNLQINAYLLAHSTDFENFEDAKYGFKVIEKLKELKVEHYIIAQYYAQYCDSLDTFSMPLDRIYFVELFLKEIYELLVEKLNIENDNLGEDIWDLKSLQYLDLCNYELSKLPIEISELKNLQRFDLMNNPDLDFIDTFLKLSKLENLQTIDLGSNQFKSLPEGIEKLKNLRSLDLGLNPDLNFADAFRKLGKLKNLQWLNLHQNQLKSLPDSLGEIKNLQSFHLSLNPSLDFADAFQKLGKLKNLQWLNLDTNYLKSLPDSLGELKNLQELDLSFGQLTDLPDSLGELENLQCLNLTYNQFTTLPDSLGKLKNLQELDLSSNQLTVLPDSIGELKNLQELDLGYNQLTTLSDSLGKLKNLQCLVLNANILSLEEINKILVLLPQLEALYLGNLNLNNLPNAVLTLKKLKVLDLTNYETFLSKKNNPNIFSEEEQTKIRKLLPNCEVKF